MMTRRFLQEGLICDGVGSELYLRSLWGEEGGVGDVVGVEGGVGPKHRRPVDLLVDQSL
jgi:hypothetical protein